MLLFLYKSFSLFQNEFQSYINQTQRANIVDINEVKRNMPEAISTKTKNYKMPIVLKIDKLSNIIKKLSEKRSFVVQDETLNIEQLNTTVKQWLKKTLMVKRPRQLEEPPKKHRDMKVFRRKPGTKKDKLMFKNGEERPVMLYCTNQCIRILQIKHN